MSLALLRKAFGMRRTHVAPFLVLGDPTPEHSFALASAATNAGATMLELGLPYGDACADGPAIQMAAQRAIEAGTTTAKAFQIMARMRAAFPDVPFNLLVYGNLVHARGFDRFCHEAANSGASTLLVPDIPVEESGPLRRACRAAGLGFVLLVGPLTPPARLMKLDQAAGAFLYVAAHQGVTGAREDDGSAAAELVRRLHSAVKHPLCLGFGLSRRVQVRAAFTAGAQIAVIGSHLARSIEVAWADPAARTEEGLVARFLGAFNPLVRVAAEDLLPSFESTSEGGPPCS